VCRCWFRDVCSRDTHALVQRTCCRQSPVQIVAQRLKLRVPSIKVSESRPWLRGSLNFENAFLKSLCLEQSLCCIVEFKTASPRSLGVRTVGVSVGVNFTSHLIGPLQAVTDSW
jgi:hypothetical protein